LKRIAVGEQGVLGVVEFVDRLPQVRELVGDSVKLPRNLRQGVSGCTK
jgi:hypothetical protein